MIPFKLLYELAYVGNVGIHELMMFYQSASPEQVELLEALLKDEKISKAIRLIEDVTGVKLQEDVVPYGDESKNKDKSKVAAQRAMDRQKKRKAEYPDEDPTKPGALIKKPKSNLQEARQTPHEAAVKLHHLINSGREEELKPAITNLAFSAEFGISDLGYAIRDVEKAGHFTSEQADQLIDIIISIENDPNIGMRLDD